MTKTVEFIKTIENRVIIDKDNGGEIIFSKAKPPTETELLDTEGRLEVKLPNSYKDFLLYCGAADFYGVQLWGLAELYRFDNECWEMEGMIPFAVDFMGRHHCFKPSTTTEEYEVFITSHDPFGYAKVADNFYEWCKLQNSIMLNFETNSPSFKHPFIDADVAIYASWKRHKATLPKKWYEFWK
jgi:hypothetical protein